MSEKYKYVYENPLDKGYTKFKLTKKQHNSLFKYRQIKWFDNYQYYYNETEIIMERFTNTFGKIITTLLFPISVVVVGFSDSKEALVDLYKQKEKGHFTSDIVWKRKEHKDVLKPKVYSPENVDKYKLIMEIIQSK